MHEKYFSWSKDHDYYRMVAKLMPSIEKLDTQNPIIGIWVNSINNFTTNAEDNTIYLNANITFQFSDDVDKPKNIIQFHVNNVKTELDIQWKRIFMTMPYGYGNQNVWFPRMVDYDFCTCQTALDEKATTVKVGAGEVDNLARNFPMRHVLN